MHRRCLGDFLDPPGVDAMGADENPPRLSVHPGSYTLQIGLPDSLGLIISVADAVSD